ncbi:CD209 antigen, partial [Sciurus carolinensis]|nr:CD209 antigen [Sciurus carolinensis]
QKVYQELTQLKAGVGRLCRPCPWDWTFFQGNCYFFSKSLRNWHDSVTACQEEGAQLVVIESAEEQSLLQQTSHIKGSPWMGLSDLNKEGAWHWVEVSPLSLKWVLGEGHCLASRVISWSSSLSGTWGSHSLAPGPKRWGHSLGGGRRSSPSCAD